MYIIHSNSSTTMEAMVIIKNKYNIIIGIMIDGKYFDKSTVARLDTVFIRFTVTTVSGYQN